MLIEKLRTLYQTWTLADGIRSFYSQLRVKDHTRPGSTLRRLIPLRISCNNKSVDLWVRDGTSDVYILKEVFVNRCYAIPREISVEGNITVLDIGANVGLATLYLLTVFPEATLHAFEPVKENFDVLRLNTQAHPNVQIHNCVVSDRDGLVPFASSSDTLNRGGGGIHPSGGEMVPSVRISTFCQSHAISEIDVLKIDCEGGEYEILFGMDRQLLSRVKLITGELHGATAWALLKYLSQWFEIGLHKDVGHLNCTFTAVNREMVVRYYGPRPQPLADWYEYQDAAIDHKS